MTPPPVTVALPVYNGGALLGECLACLAGQSFPDFRVLICDNASTDETADRAAGMAASDPRFVHLRRPENIGPAANFAAAMHEAESPLFLWRAHDDLSAPDYLAVLVAALAAAPGAQLAAAAVLRERLHPDGRSSRRRIPFVMPEGANPAARLRHGLAHVHPGWFYGLWRRAAITRLWSAVLARYPHAWASDMLILARALAEGGVTGSDATHFHQRLVEKPGAHATQRAPGQGAEMARRRRLFVTLCREAAGLDDLPLAERLRTALAIERFAERRGGRRLRILRARLRDLLRR